MITFDIVTMADMPENTNVVEFSLIWQDLFGKKLPKNFSMLVRGSEKNGKSSFVLRMAEYLAENHGKVMYFSAEEGHGLSIELRVKEILKITTKELKSLVWKKNFKEGLLERHPQFEPFDFFVFDSWQRMEITDEEYMRFREIYHDKAVIVISQLNNKGLTGIAKVQHEVDVVVDLKSGFNVNVKSRYAADSIKGQSIFGLHKDKKLGESKKDSTQKELFKQ